METQGIYKAVLAVMKDTEAISKNRTNEQQGYKFRGIDDAYNALHPLLSKHGVFTVPEVLEERREQRETSKGGILNYAILKIRYTFFAGDGSSVTATVIGEGMDSGDKASNKAMAVAHKYALLQIFAIPTEDPKDPEIDSPEPVVVKAPIQREVEKVLNEMHAEPVTAFDKRPQGNDKLKYQDELWPFGKHKGKQFNEIPDFAGYIKWAKQNLTSPAAFEAIKKAEIFLSDTGMPF